MQKSCTRLTRGGVIVSFQNGNGMCDIFDQALLYLGHTKLTCVCQHEFKTKCKDFRNEYIFSLVTKSRYS